MVTIGGHYIPPDVIHPELGRQLRRGRGKYTAASLRKLRCTDPTLSPRQEQIMRCIHMGSTNKMIAKMLGISEGTVKIHLAGVFQPLGATNRAAWPSTTACRTRIWKSFARAVTSRNLPCNPRRPTSLPYVTSIRH